MVDLDSDPALVGVNASFLCPSRRLLIGPSKASCMGNGFWEPDLRESECKGMYVNTRLKLMYRVNLAYNFN